MIALEESVLNANETIFTDMIEAALGDTNEDGLLTWHELNQWVPTALDDLNA